MRKSLAPTELWLKSNAFIWQFYTTANAALSFINFQHFLLTNSIKSEKAAQRRNSYQSYFDGMFTAFKILNTISVKIQTNLQHDEEREDFYSNKVVDKWVKNKNIESECSDSWKSEKVYDRN